MSLLIETRTPSHLVDLNLLAYVVRSDDEAIEIARELAEKIAKGEIAILAADKLHELGGTRSTLAQYNLDRHWRNARTHTVREPVRWKNFAIGNFHLNGIKPPRYSWL